MAKKRLSREEILNSQDIKIEEVDVPEWGGIILVRGIGGRERDSYQQSLSDGRWKLKWENATAKLVAMACIDGDGKRLFSDDDIKALGEKSAGALQRIFDVALRLSGMSQGAFEEIQKNSDATQSDPSILS